MREPASHSSQSISTHHPSHNPDPSRSSVSGWAATASLSDGPPVADVATTYVCDPPQALDSTAGAAWSTGTGCSAQNGCAFADAVHSCSADCVRLDGGGSDADGGDPAPPLHHHHHRCPGARWKPNYLRASGSRPCSGRWPGMYACRVQPARGCLAASTPVSKSKIRRWSCCGRSAWKQECRRPRRWSAVGKQRPPSRAGDQ